MNPDFRDREAAAIAVALAALVVQAGGQIALSAEQLRKAAGLRVTQTLDPATGGAVYRVG